MTGSGPRDRDGQADLESAWRPAASTAVLNAAVNRCGKPFPPPGHGRLYGCGVLVDGHRPPLSARTHTGRELGYVLFSVGKTRLTGAGGGGGGGEGGLNFIRLVLPLRNFGVRQGDFPLSQRGRVVECGEVNLIDNWEVNLPLQLFSRTVKHDCVQLASWLLLEKKLVCIARDEEPK